MVLSVTHQDHGSPFQGITSLHHGFSAVHPKYSTPYRAVIFTMPIAIAFAFSGFLDQVITFSITSGLVCYVMIPFSLIRFRKMFPEHTQKVRPFVGPLQPYLAYFTIFLAIVIMSTLNWGYSYNPCLRSGVLCGCILLLLVEIQKHRIKTRLGRRPWMA